MMICQSSEIFPRTLMHIFRGGIFAVTTGYQFVGEEYCLARPDIRLPNSRHVETCVLLSRGTYRQPDARVKIDVELEDYYAIKDSKKE